MNLGAEGTEATACRPLCPTFTPRSRRLEAVLVLAQPLRSKQEIKKCVYFLLKRKNKTKPEQKPLLGITGMKDERRETLFPLLGNAVVMSTSCHRQSRTA